LHDALDRFTVDADTLLAEASPNHSIAKIRLGVDEILDALRHHFIDNWNPIVLAVKLYSNARGSNTVYFELTSASN
jgi:hypothetical protein